MALKRRGIRLNIVDGNPSSRSVLESKAARLPQADTVVLCGLEDREQAAADMQVGSGGDIISSVVSWFLLCFHTMQWLVGEYIHFYLKMGRCYGHK